jgi:hypothetical protein
MIFWRMADSYSARFEPDPGRPLAQELKDALFGLRSDLGEVGVQLIFRNSLDSVKLIDAALDLGIDGVFVFQQPAALFFLCFEKAEQRFLWAGCPGGLNLFLDASLQGLE